MQALPLPVVVALWALLGLLIGSFLNVVIHRLPRMLQAQWAAECAQWQLTTPTQPTTDTSGASDAATAPRRAAPTPYNLWQPRSHCPACQTPIAWWHNVPVLSYLALRGRCAHCQAPISLRYPAVELACAALFALCALQHGATGVTVAYSGLGATVLALALIDWDTTLLPDDLTLPLLWMGLVLAALHITPVALPDALWGAVGGYGALWAVYWAFKLATGKEGMGYGDFKLYAALGAWLGWTALIPLILMASVVGAVVGLILKFASGLRPGGYIPFGPFLAGGGLVVMLSGPNAVLRAIGLG